MMCLVKAERETERKRMRTFGIVSPLMHFLKDDILVDCLVMFMNVVVF